MRKLFTMAALIVSSLSLFAQKNDPEAKAVLDAVSKKFRSFTTVQANFTYKVENAEGKAISTKTGTLWMKGSFFCANRERLETIKAAMVNNFRMLYLLFYC